MGRKEKRAQQKTKQPNNYIHQEKRWKAHIREMVPKIYAGFCLSLHRRYGMTFEQIYQALVDTQEYWQSDGTGGFDILKTCSEETGINLLSKVTADAAGIEEGDHETYEGVEM